MMVRAEGAGVGAGLWEGLGAGRGDLGCPRERERKESLSAACRGEAALWGGLGSLPGEGAQGREANVGSGGRWVLILEGLGGFQKGVELGCLRFHLETSL